MRRVMSALRYVEGGRYRFVLTEDLIVDLRLHLRGFHVLQDRGRTFAVLDDDQLTIRKGYACDGCSPAWRVFGRWVGVPTPHPVVAAAFVHDCMRGYLDVACLTYSREDTDRVFVGLMEETNFDMRGVYHAAVAGVWGSAYDRITRRGPNQATCRCHTPHNLVPATNYPCHALLPVLV